jgi:hypothetical protein
VIGRCLRPGWQQGTGSSFTQTGDTIFVRK